MPLVKFYICCTFLIFCRSVFKQNIDFLSLKMLKLWVFLMLETFVVFWGHMRFYNIIYMFFKVQFWIVEPNRVTDGTDFVVLSPICTVREPVFHRIINWTLSGFAFIKLYENHSYTFYISCIKLVISQE